MILSDDDVAVNTMMALIEGVYGELRNPTQLRGHVAVIMGASIDLCMDDQDAWDEAQATLHAYRVVTTCACDNAFCPDHPYQGAGPTE